MRDALDRLGQRLGSLRVAPLYRTAPVLRSGAVDRSQPSYLNTVVLGQLSGRSPQRAARFLVGLGKALEQTAGRSLASRSSPALDAPRPLDIDLLLLGEQVVELAADGNARPAGTEGEPWWPGPITVPHPRLHARRFVLAPLADLAPDLAVPPDGTSVAELLAALDEARFDHQQVERLTVGAPFGVETV